MFEARLVSSGTLKKVLDSIKDLLNEATFDCSDAGIQVRILQLDAVLLDILRIVPQLSTAASSNGQLPRLPRLS